MATFLFTGDAPLVLADLKAPDGSTCAPEPGEFEVAEVLNPKFILDHLHLLEPVDDEAKALVAEARGEPDASDIAPPPPAVTPPPAPPSPPAA